MAKTIIKEAVAGAAGNVAANVVNSAIDSITQKVGRQKRPSKAAANDSTIATKIKKLDIDRMIDGSGIVYD